MQFLYRILQQDEAIRGKECVSARWLQKTSESDRDRESMSPAGEYENKEQAGLADQSNVYAGIKKSLARGYKKVPGLVIRPGTW